MAMQPLDAENMATALGAAIRSGLQPEQIIHNLRHSGEGVAVKLIAMITPEGILEKIAETAAGRKLQAEFRHEFLHDYFARLIATARSPAK